METRMNREQAINWLKNAQKRQQEWQQEVKRRWAERPFAYIRVMPKADNRIHV
jgi:hypothetical protein